MDDPAITCDEITESNNEEVEAILYDEANFKENKATCKTQNFYIFLAFLLITIALLIAVSIYSYLIKFHAKQLLPFHYTKKESREVLY